MAISLTLFYGSPNAHNGAAVLLGSIARASQKLNAIALSQFRVNGGGSVRLPRRALFARVRDDGRAESSLVGVAGALAAASVCSPCGPLYRTAALDARGA
jgi:hypothetical protein